MGKVENENISFWHPCFFYFTIFIKAVDKTLYSFSKGYIAMSLLKIKRLSQSCLIVFLLLLPVSAFSEYALYFNGNSRVDLGSSNWFPGWTYTIEASIMPESSEGLSYIISTAGMWGNNVASLVFENNTVSLYTRGYYDTGTAYTASAILPPDRYTYIAATFNEGTQNAKIYINGIELPVSSSIVSMPFPYTYSVGNLSEWSQSGYGLNGYLDAVVVSGVEKSASEIADTVQNGLDCAVYNAGCWLFEEGSGYVALDSSGNGHSGSLVGTGGNSGYIVASAPGGSASSLAFGESGGGSGGSGSGGSGVNAAFTPVGGVSGVASGVGAIAIGAAGMLAALSAYSAIKGIFKG